MARKRPRSLPPIQLLLIAYAIPTRGFLRLPATRPACFTTAPSSNVISSSHSKPTAAYRRWFRNTQHRLFAQSAQQRRRRRTAGSDEGTSGTSSQGNRFDTPRFWEGGLDDPNDPLPRTMEELNRQLALNPPVDPRSKDDDLGSLRPEDLDIIEDVVRDAFEPMQDEKHTWWAEHGDELEHAVTTLKVSGDGKKEELVWDLDRVFSGIDDEVYQDGQFLLPPFSLTAYKAGGAETLTASEAFELTPYAEYWDSLPDIGATKRVYPYNAVDRMAALKYMMNCTASAMYGKRGTPQTGHFLWGYVDQLDWMRRSGRLSPTAPGSIKIDRDSWWNHVSFALTIAPLAAAIGSGIMAEGVSVLDTEELQRPEMKRAVRAWRRVWLYRNAEISQRLLVDMPVHDALQEDLRRVMWAAHLESLDAVEALYEASLDALPQAEQEYARGWCRAARLCAVSAAHTNLDEVIFPLGAGYPPERILDRRGRDGNGGSDSLESVPYGPPEMVDEAESDPVAQRSTRRCVKSIRWLGTLPAPAFAALRLLLRRSCVSYPARRGAARALHRGCMGGVGAKARTWGRSILFTMVPDVNYRKLTPPFGIDPAVEVEYDPDMEKRDPNKPLPRPAGSYPLNPLQRPWYDGPWPRRRFGQLPEEDDDDGFGTAFGGMFPKGMGVPDFGFDATERDKKEIDERVLRAKEMMANNSARGRSHSGDTGMDSWGRFSTHSEGEDPQDTVFA